MKKVAASFAVFLGLMLVCTVVSKSIYAYRLPMVTTCIPESMYVEHTVKAEGIVVAGGEKPVTYLSGLRIDSMPVHVGDRAEEGDVLFTVDLDDLKKLMDEKEDEISKVSLQINTILENQEIARQKKELELARAREDYDTTARIKDTQVGRALESYVQAEQELVEDQENGGGDSEGDKALKNALQSAAYGEADARAERDEAVKQAGRKVEDMLMPEESASDLDVARLEKSNLSEQLSVYQQVWDEQGMVRAPFGGIITEILAGVGDRIPDTAVLLISDESLPCQLKVLLDKEQKKYIGLGDKLSVKVEGKSRELEKELDYLSESKNAPEKYEALVNLPEDTGIPGMSGSISRTETGEKYKLCIPVTAINEKDDRSSVYVMKEREGILGQEYYIDEVNVKILDKNDNWAALDAGAVDQDSKIILSATKEIKKGDVVRWEE